MTDNGSRTRQLVEEDAEPTISQGLLDRGRQWRGLATSRSIARHMATKITADTAVRSPTRRRRRSSVATEAFLVAHRPLADNVDKFSVAAAYITDALHGRRPATCIHDGFSLGAMNLLRDAWFNRIFNFAVMLHCALPIIEEPPCGRDYTATTALYRGISGGPSGVSGGGALGGGGGGGLSGGGVGGFGGGGTWLAADYRPTVLLSSTIECFLCAFYALELLLVWTVRDRCSGRAFVETATVWPAVRMALVAALAADLAGFFFWQVALGGYWYRWGRLVTPHILTLKRTYLQLFAAGLVRMLPRILPVILLISFVTFFWGYVGYLLFHNKTFGLHLPFLDGLGFFQYLLTSVRTMLRVFTSIPFMLDLEQLYHDINGIRIFTLTYALLSVVFLGSLIIAVANKLFQQQNAQAYMAVRTQRALALRCAYALLKAPDGTVSLEAWQQLMRRLRPTLSAAAATVLFRAGGGGGAPGSRIKREAFYEICALTNADVRVGGESELKGSVFTGSIADLQERRMPWLRRRRVRRLRRAIYSAIEYRVKVCGVRLKPYATVFNIMILLHAAELVLLAVSGEPWTNRLGLALITFFWCDSVLHLFVLGPALFASRWDQRVGLALNLVGLAYRLWWPAGEAAKDVYTVVMSTRIVLLWRVLHDYDGHHTDVASRLMLIVPAMVRAFMVLLSIVYSFSVLAHGMLCGSAIGAGNIDEFRTEPLVMRWYFYKDVLSFRSFGYSLLSMLDVMLVSNWPLVMDAAVAVTGKEFAMRTFFYVYKVYVFYIVTPVMMGFVVQAYMATRSGADSIKSSASLGFASDSDGNGGRCGGGGDGDLSGEGEISPTVRPPQTTPALTERRRTLSSMYFGSEATQQSDATRAARDIHALEEQLEASAGELRRRDEVICHLRKRLMMAEREAAAGAAAAARAGGIGGASIRGGGLGFGGGDGSGDYGSLHTVDESGSDDEESDVSEGVNEPGEEEEEEEEAGGGGGGGGGGDAENGFAVLPRRRAAPLPPPGTGQRRRSKTVLQS